MRRVCSYLIRPVLILIYVIARLVFPLTINELSLIRLDIKLFFLYANDCCRLEKIYTYCNSQYDYNNLNDIQLNALFCMKIKNISLNINIYSKAENLSSSLDNLSNFMT